MTLLDTLREPALHLFGAPVTWAELFGDVSGVLCVYGVARQKVWSWPVGIVNNAFFFLLFWTAKLYADAVLQIIFAALGFYGWYAWVAGRKNRPELPVRRIRRREAVILGVFAIAGTLIAARFLATSTDSPVPFWDSAVLALSLAATYGQAEKIIESWWVWIGVDVICVPLYVSRGLYPTALLYLIFMGLCVYGLRDWKKQLS